MNLTPRPCRTGAPAVATLTAVPRNLLLPTRRPPAEKARSPMPFNVPILLTWLRVALSRCLSCCFIGQTHFASTVRNGLAALIFALAAITDWLDGYLARKWANLFFGAFLTRWPTS